jgi:predicted SnoaL-like aldol condensation-catalyzing enzyme
VTTLEERNQGLVLTAFDTLFNQHDFAAAEPFWSPDYVQHSAHIAPGRKGLFDLVAATPALRHEAGLVVASGDHVMVHGRFTGLGLPVAWIVVDVVRVENGLLAEHWDVIQDEAPAEASLSGLPMFGSAFPETARP